jgi:hypothetical protein
MGKGPSLAPWERVFVAGITPFFCVRAKGVALVSFLLFLSINDSIDFLPT